MNIFYIEHFKKYFKVFSKFEGNFNSSNYKSQNHKRKDNSKILKIYAPS